MPKVKVGFRSFLILAALLFAHRFFFMLHQKSSIKFYQI